MFEKIVINPDRQTYDTKVPPIRCSEEFLSKLDKVAKKTKTDRSSLIRQVMDQFCDHYLSKGEKMSKKKPTKKRTPTCVTLAKEFDKKSIKQQAKFFDHVAEEVVSRNFKLGSSFFDEEDGGAEAALEYEEHLDNNTRGIGEALSYGAYDYLKRIVDEFERLPEDIKQYKRDMM